ncbi:MAG: PorT family protein [Chitinophagaceae bacterium]|nr:PorT family protein [Chitinophagaceae bacterium]
MYLKKIVLVSIFVMGMLSAKTQVTFGVHANGIMTTMEGKTEDEEANFKYRFSWKIGGLANIPLTDYISFMPQLNVLSKGAKVEESATEDIFGDPETYSIKANFKLTYLELPLTVIYNSGDATMGFFVGAGPSVSYGLGGEISGKVSYTYQGETETESFNSNVKFDGDENADDDDAHFKPFDFGAHIIAGYRLSNGLFINAHYNHGFSNVSPQDGTTIKNRYFGLGVGYSFSRLSVR